MPVRMKIALQQIYHAAQIIKNTAAALSTHLGGRCA